MVTGALKGKIHCGLGKGHLTSELSKGNCLYLLNLHSSIPSASTICLRLDTQQSCLENPVFPHCLALVVDVNLEQCFSTFSSGNPLSALFLSYGLLCPTFCLLHSWCDPYICMIFFFFLGITPECGPPKNAPK